MNHRIFILLSLILIGAGSFFFNYHFKVSADSLGILVSVTEAQCSDGIDNDGDFQTDYPDDSNCSSSGDNNENIDGVEVHSTTTITTAGGSHSFNNDDSLAVNFTFPANFHTTSTRLFVNSYASGFFESSKPAPTDKSFIGKTYDIILYDSSSTQSIATTSEAITIIFRYKDADVSGIYEPSAAPYRYNSTSSAWEEVSDSSLDQTNNKVTFSTSNFGSFALFGTNISSFQCSDSIDNDGDGKVDYPDDPGCASVTDNDETDPAAPDTPTGGGSGGGGGGGIRVSETASVILSGKAFPGKAVNILIDGKISDTVIADKFASWSKRFLVGTGSRSFGAYSSDSKGRRSLTYTFNLNVNTGTVSTVSGIFIAPTIDTNKQEVRRGDAIEILGQTVPNSNVKVAVNSEHEIIESVQSDENGNYFLAFNTTPLEYGSHSASSRALLENTFSALSNIIQFKVGTRNITKKPSGDISGDNKVNITDFSIMLFWWGNTTEKALGVADVNKDNKIDLRDMSIMLFYWTG